MNPIRSEHDLLLSQAEALLASERHPIAHAANLSALIFSQWADVNWAGFYFTVDEGSEAGPQLLVGPFQGLPACIRLPWGRGVCGTAAATRTTQIVDDVHAFDGHIACDSASRSELVVPLVEDDRVVGVLDIDSPRPARFSGADAQVMQGIADLWLTASNLDGLKGYSGSI